MTELSNPQPAKPPRSQWLDVWDQFKSHRGALMGGALFLFIVLAVYLGRSSGSWKPPRSTSVPATRVRAGPTLLAPTSWAGTCWPG